jgi:hypothetical protein
MFSNDSEGYHLSDYLESMTEYRVKKPLLSNLKPNAVERYNLNKIAKVGDEIICPTCGKHFTKKSYQHVFCRKRGVGKSEGKGNLCKDTYHNSVNETRRERAKSF